MNKKFNCCIKDHKGETIHDEDYKKKKLLKKY